MTFQQGQVLKTFTTKKGNTAIIRLPQPSDLEELLRYVNELSAEDTFVALNGEVITREQEEKYLSGLLSDMQNGNAVHVLSFINNVLVGNAGLTRGIRRHSHVGSLGISVAPDYREEGIGQELMLLLIEKAKEMNLKIVTLSCFANNLRALHVYKKLGFQEAGIIPQAYSYKDGYVDEVKMYMLLNQPV